MSYLSRGNSPVISHAPRTFRKTARRVMCAADKRGSSLIRSQLRTVTRETSHAFATCGIPTSAIAIAARVLSPNVSPIADEITPCSKHIVCGISATSGKAHWKRAGFHGQHQYNASRPKRIAAYARSCQLVTGGG